MTNNVIQLIWLIAALAGFELTAIKFALDSLNSPTLQPIPNGMLDVGRRCS